MAYRNPSHGYPVERSSDIQKKWWIGTFGVRVEDSVKTIPYNDGVSTLSRMIDNKGNYIYDVYVQEKYFNSVPFEREEYFELFCELMNGEYYYSPEKTYAYINKYVLKEESETTKQDDM